MKIKGISRPTAAAIFAVAALNGAFLFVNGLFMLVAPAQWYHIIPGVTLTGCILSAISG